MEKGWRRRSPVVLPPGKVDRIVVWVAASKKVYGIQGTVIRIVDMFRRVGMSDAQ